MYIDTHIHNITNHWPLSITAAPIRVSCSQGFRVFPNRPRADPVHARPACHFEKRKKDGHQMTALCTQRCLSLLLESSGCRYSLHNAMMNVSSLTSFVLFTFSMTSLCNSLMFCSFHHLAILRPLFAISGRSICFSVVYTFLQKNSAKRHLSPCQALSCPGF